MGVSQVGGFWGKLARVDLSNGRITYEELSEQFFRTYYGGAAAIAYYLLKEIPEGIDPLGPQNKLIFAPGVITGAPVPGSGRNAIGAKSPMTNGYGKTEAGGYWGVELKRAGIDILIVEGKADVPVYLWIKGDSIEIRNARHLWGLPIKETQEMMQQELGEKKLRTALIGPGGENMVRYACVINDLHHAAGRTGMGAVMGSKNLKGIAVLGDKKVPVADGEGLKRCSQWIGLNYKKLVPGLVKYGTGSALIEYNVQGNLPTRNFHDGYFDEAEQISAMTLMDTIGVRMSGCFSCPIKCKKIVQWGELVDPAYGGPEYETLAGFGSNCGISDVKIIAAANAMCNAASIDVISTSVTIGFAMECFEKGLLTPKDTGGIELSFGNSDALLKVLELIIKREGIGDLLAEGVMRVARKLGGGSEAFAIHVKGLEVGMHEPRLKFGLGLGYSVAAVGADHGMGIHDTYFSSDNARFQDIKGIGFLEPLPTNSMDPKKVSLVADLHRWRTFEDSLVTCYFVPFNFEKLIEVVKAVTGWNTTVYEGMKVGERAIQLARIFNIREGIGSQYDRLPGRFSEPVPRGGNKGAYISPEELEQALLYYYQEMGWTVNGVPGRYVLEKLDIGWAYGFLDFTANKEALSS
jgi:aldehyde:ferredoxin oxidoreductase